MNSETGVGFLSDRNALIDVLQHMESEDLIAIDGDDVVMIWLTTINNLWNRDKKIKICISLIELIDQ